MRITKFVITENKIETRGDNSIGIVLLTDRAIVSSNQINLNGGPNAIAIWQGCSDSIIANNKIGGSGSCAIMLSAFGGLVPRRNVTMRNDVTLFKASMANLLLQGSNNLAIEKTSGIVDKDQTNLVFK
jgi:hypothetical protein